MMNRHGLILLLPFAFLAGCGEKGGADGRSAEGEVLEGSISDAMLPLDRLRSQAPLAEPEAAARSGVAAPASAPAAPADAPAQPAAEGGDDPIGAIADGD